MSLSLSSIGQSLNDTVKLNEVMIISTYRPTEKTPVTESVIKKEEIKQNATVQEVPTFLNSIPSISSCSDGGHENGYTYFRLRVLTKPE